MLAGVVGLTGLVVALGGWQRADPDTPFRPRPSRISPGAIDGRAALRPDTITPAATGSYELRITIGSTGLPTHGAMLVAFPKTWFAHPFPLSKRLQRSDASKPHFLSVKSSRSGAAFDVTVDTVGFTGKIERFNQTIGIVDTGAALQPGDVVSVVLANTNAPYCPVPTAHARRNRSRRRRPLRRDDGRREVRRDARPCRRLHAARSD